MARKTLLFPLVFLVLALIFLAAARRIRGMGLRDLFSSPQDSAARVVLEEIKNLENLETALYSLNAVFPYDFADENTDWNTLKSLYDLDPLSFNERAISAAQQRGSDGASWRRSIELYSRCRALGLDPGKPDHNFLMIAATVRAGLDLETWRSELNGNVENIDGIIRLPAPEAVITALVIEDRDRPAEGFPDVPITPDNWRRIVESLESELLDMSLKRGLLKEASQGGQNFLAGIFAAAGYPRVEFQ